MFDKAGEFERSQQHRRQHARENADRGRDHSAKRQDQERRRQGSQQSQHSKPSRHRVYPFGLLQNARFLLMKIPLILPLNGQVLTQKNIDID